MAQKGKTREEVFNDYDAYVAKFNGGGLLLSDDARRRADEARARAAEVRAARACARIGGAAEISYELSEREKEIVKKLNSI